MADGKVPMGLRRKIFRRGNYEYRGCGLTGYEARWKNRRGRINYSFPTSVPGVYLSIDHVKPHSRGGSNNPRNLQVLCAARNTAKGVRSAI